MSDLGMLLIKALILGCIVTAVLGFVLYKFLSKSTETAVSRLNKETEMVRGKQSELNQKIKEANEELVKRRAEADALVLKMKEEAEQKAKEEREKIVNKARKDGDEIIAKAQRTKEDMRKALEDEIDLKAVDFSAYILKEVFADKAKGALDDTLIADFLSNLKEMDMSMISKEIDKLNVFTVRVLDNKYKEKLQEIIKVKLGREIMTDYAIDEKIIAGIVIKFGSLALDGSLSHILTEKAVEMKEKLEKGILQLS